jgi:hypothetical protein
LVATAVVVLVAGCGGDEDAPAEEESTGVGQVLVGSVAPLAQCVDWNGGTEDERRATVTDIREQINLEDGPVRTPSLDDEEAYDLFERACAQPAAETNRLYVIYSRAAGFAAVLED